VSPRLLAVALGVIAFSWVPAAFASPVAELLGPSGKVVAAAGSGAFAYPADGSALTIAAASVTPAKVELKDVSMLAGLIRVASVTISPRTRTALVQGLVVSGRPVQSGVNGIVPVGPSSYLITSQIAVTGGAVGVVGMRLSIGDTRYGLPAGTQILVGLPATPAATKIRTPAQTTPIDPLAIFAFTTGPTNPSFSPPLPLLSPFGTGTTGQQAAAIAERYLGMPYVWGGASPAVGFDCSGLTMFVYAQLGIHLTHYTGAQYNEGTPIAPTDLQAGDLVFFDPSSAGPQHEGIYLGGNQFIQAPHTGSTVQVSSLLEPAYALTYAGAVRPNGT
jgi:cell wall-associated NlpC family hydrolase